MKSNPEPRAKAYWRPVTGKPSPLWQKLWARLFIDKKGDARNQSPAKDASERGRQRNHP